MTNNEMDKVGQVGEVESTGEGPYGPTETRRIFASDFTWYDFAAERVNRNFPYEVSMKPGKSKDEKVTTFPVDSLFIAFADMAAATYRMVVQMYSEKYGPSKPPYFYDKPELDDLIIRHNVKEPLKQFFAVRLGQQGRHGNDARQAASRRKLHGPRDWF